MVHMATRTFWAASLLASLGACSSGEPDEGPVLSPDLVLPYVTVIDGLGGPPAENQTVEIRAGLITSVRPSTPADSGLDVSGKFVTPGLIDTHQHLPLWESEEAVSAALESLLMVGVTSVREMACCADAYLRLTASGDSAHVARLFWSVYWSDSLHFANDPRVRENDGAGSVPSLLAIDESTDLEAAVLAARETGATGVKIYSNVRQQLLEQVVDVAHARGMQVWTHPVVFPTRPSDVISSGVDVISHAALFVWEGADELPETYNGGHRFNPFGPPAPYATVAPDDPRVLLVLESLRDRGVILDPTVSTIAGPVGEEASQWGVRLTRLAHQMGVPISTGTDHPAAGAEALFVEMEMLVESVGMSSSEVLVSATSVGAAVLGAEQSLGSIRPGMVADLVVYDEDPTQDISVLRRPAFVLKSGTVVRSPSN